MGFGDFQLTRTPFLARALGSTTLRDFVFGDDNLTRRHKIRLDDLAPMIVKLLVSYPRANISVVGHTDAVGGPEANLELGKKRAERVFDGLTSRRVPAAVISFDTAGEETLAVPTLNADGRNRRVLIAFDPEPVERCFHPALKLQSPQRPKPPPQYNLYPEEAIRKVTGDDRPPSARPSQVPEVCHEYPTEIFWQRVDSGLDTIMNQWNVPPSLRGYIRRGAHASIERGVEAILEGVLGDMNLGPEANEALRSGARGFMHMKKCP
jgi:hypothetical protein